VKLFVSVLVGAVMAAVCAAAAQVQNWPARPIKLIVPTGPGAATDVMARLLADGASRGLGQPIIVENLPGASCIVVRQGPRGRRPTPAQQEELALVQATRVGHQKRRQKGGRGLVASRNGDMNG